MLSNPDIPMEFSSCGRSAHCATSGVLSDAQHEPSNLGKLQHGQPPFSRQRLAHAAVLVLRVARLPSGRPLAPQPLLHRRGSASAIFPPVSCKRQRDPPHPPRGQVSLSLLDSNPPTSRFSVPPALCKLSSFRTRWFDDVWYASSKKDKA